LQVIVARTREIVEKSEFIKNSIKKFEKHLGSHRNEIIGLDFIMKVARCRAALYPLRTQHITLGGAYSDTAAVTSCSRQSQYLKS